jgi:hypothetical protein
MPVMKTQRFDVTFGLATRHGYNYNKTRIRIIEEQC